MAKIFIVCTGLDRIQRGGEVYARDLFDSLSRAGGNDVYVVKGGGGRGRREIRIPCVDRNAAIAPVLARWLRKSPVWIEYATFLPLFLLAVVVHRPHAIYCVEHPIFRALVRLRPLCRNARLITHSGVQVSQLPRDANSRFHYVTEEFETPDGERLSVQPGDIVIPHYIPRRVLDHIAAADRAKLRQTVRAKFAVADHQKILISVGSLDRSVKRMDWLVREVAATREFFLLMVGSRSHETPQLEWLCAELLPGRHAFDVGSRLEVLDLMLGSDLYVSGSLREGFGLANLEAALCALPVIVHGIPEVRWVLGDCATYGDLTRSDVLPALAREAFVARAGRAAQRRGLDRFKEEAVIPQFQQLFD